MGIVLGVEKRHRIGMDTVQFEPTRRRVHGVGTPASLKRGAVAREILGRRTYQLHAVIMPSRVTDFRGSPLRMIFACPDVVDELELLRTAPLSALLSITSGK